MLRVLAYVLGDGPPSVEVSVGEFPFVGVDFDGEVDVDSHVQFLSVAATHGVVEVVEGIGVLPECEVHLGLGRPDDEAHVGAGVPLGLVLGDGGGELHGNRVGLPAERIHAAKVGAELSERGACLAGGVVGAQEGLGDHAAGVGMAGAHGGFLSLWCDTRLGKPT